MVVWRLHKGDIQGRRAQCLENHKQLSPAEKAGGYSIIKGLSHPTESNQRLFNKGVIKIRFILETETWQDGEEKVRSNRIKVWKSGRETKTMSKS